ncbi:LysR family transcriptional regulator [Pseudooceanicola sp. CBS1P-1]|uniref:LysR family transcriptional regulator n=2 Tax=Paracoccaceae TaxID=31989 RepID=A0A6L7G7U7_9RHOB|nr:LysR family transcriptional regulator [Pseudooceanicola endophyticus]MXN19618.1 LysR family transcriptional regulator [Pseudooceanicola albus]
MAPAHVADTPAERLARDLDWNLLRTFVVLAQSSSVSDAAQRLRLSQPTVSMALKRLEDRLGRQLIDRRPGHFALTDAGRLLREEAVEIEGAVRRLGVLLRETREEVQGHVTLMLASHVVTPILDQALSRFHRQHPRATLSLEVVPSRDAVALVSARRATAAICLLREPAPKLVCETVYREHFGLFCGPPHPLFRRPEVSEADLAGQRHVSHMTDTHAVELMLMAMKLDPNVVARSSNTEELRRMIMAGIGIGPLPVHVAAEDVARGRLRRLPPLDQAAPAVDVQLIWHPQARLNRAEVAFLEILRTEIEVRPFEERIYG